MGMASIDVRDEVYPWPWRLVWRSLNAGRKPKRANGKISPSSPWAWAAFGAYGMKNKFLFLGRW